MRIRLARASGATFGVDDLACAAATRMGLFAAQGLEVAWSDWRGGVAATRALLDGHADVTYAGFGVALALRAQGHPLRIFVSQARALAQALVVRKDLPRLQGAAWAIDDIGALSHHMARLVVRALKIPESELRWEVVGPPPQRIAALLEGRADAALVRSEEALALHRDYTDKVRRMLDLDELKRLVPLQPHGVLATTEAYERAHPEALGALVRAMILASRALHDRFEVFHETVQEFVSVRLSIDEARLLWQREHGSGGWAVNGEMTAAHWDAQLALFRELNPQLRAVGRSAVLAEEFVARALQELGIHKGVNS